MFETIFALPNPRESHGHDLPIVSRTIYSHTLCELQRYRK